MRAATYVQAFQFVLKLVLFIVPAIWLLIQAGPQVRDEAAAPRRVHPLRARHPGRVPRRHHAHLRRAHHRPHRTERAAQAGRLGGPGGHPDHLPRRRPRARGHRRGPPRRRRLGTPAARPARRRPPAARHLGPRRRARARHHGPAARDHALPHQPRRPRRPPHRRLHRGAAQRLLPVPRHLRRARPRARPAALPVRRHRHRRRRPPRTGRRRAGRPTCSPRCSPVARSPRSSPPRSACCSSSPARSPTTCCPAASAGCASRSSPSSAIVVLLALQAIRLDAGVLVTWAFTVAASTFCPLLVLGIWWSRLTVAGAMTGVLVGLFASAARSPARSGGLPVNGLARDPRRPARAVVGPARVRHDDRRVAAAAARRAGRARPCFACTSTRTGTRTRRIGSARSEIKM